MTLNRLAEKGMVDSRLVAAPSGERGPERRLFRLTGHGLRCLNAYEVYIAELELSTSNGT